MSTLPLLRKELPIGIQTFRKIREEGHDYIDRGDAHKHQASGESIHMIGVAFSKTSRSVVWLAVQTLQSQ